MDKRFMTILAVIVIIFAGFLVFNKKSATNAPGSSSSAKPSNHLFGDGKKGVTLVEYGDLQCPACGQYYPIVKELKDKYKTDITFQYRNFPLENIHPNALAAHRAAESASKQGKFWEMHNKLYETQQSWVSLSDVKSVFEGYATELGLNLNQFKTDYVSEEVNGIINADIAEGQKLKANSTPTFILDGVKIENNPRDLTEFSKLIDDEIAKKNPNDKSTSTTSGNTTTAQ